MNKIATISNKWRMLRPGAPLTLFFNAPTIPPNELISYVRLQKAAERMEDRMAVK